MSATVSAAPGAAIASLAFQFSPYGANTWMTFRTETVAPYSASFFPAAFGVPTGTYQVRAVATDSAGQVGASGAATIVFVNSGDTYVDLAPVGPVVRGTITLTATSAKSGTPYNQFGNQPDTVSFEISPSGAGTWTTIATVAQAVDASGNPLYSAGGDPLYTFSLDTTTLADGRFDLRVEAQDAFGGVYVGGVVSAVLVDNTPPSVSLVPPGPSLTGVATLVATAADSCSGVASVRFEISPSGAGAWSTIGLLSSVPYQQILDTRGLQNGLYDLRVVATDVAGNSAVSAVVVGVSISNAVTATNPDNFTITDYVVPATDVSLLGTIAASPDGETWAYGYTTAPPAIVNGTPLRYTVSAGSEQLVLLRYTNTTGWQIADVLRNADGSPYRLASGNSPGFTIAVSGQMAPSGEAWLMLAQELPGPSGGSGPTVTAMFHRIPGGAFLLDSAATSTLGGPQGVLSRIGYGSPPTLTLGVDPSGAIYGMLVNPDQAPIGVAITTPSFAVIRTALQYGLLAGGIWKAVSAPLPPSYVATSGDVVELAAASETGAGIGWALFSVPVSGGPPTARPLILASFSPSGWSFVPATGLDALDLTGNFGGGGQAITVTPQAIAADALGAWISARVGIGSGSNVIALFDPATAHVVASWCGTLAFNESVGCGEPLDANHPATVPAAEFDTPSGAIGLALGNGFVDVYAFGVWTAVAASGFSQGSAAQASLFSGPTSGWLAGTYALGLITAQAPPSPLAAWPQANENTLVAVALPPAGAGIGTSGALAVGLGGAALHYDASAGWLVDPVPSRAQSINLLGVAFDGAFNAVAVGAFGTILDWNGTSWSEDQQSNSLTPNQLNAVVFGSDGQGWAVGTFGTILHYNGASWSLEQVDAADSGADVTSVTVARAQVFAVAGGNLITRAAGGTWQRVDPGLLPAGLPDGILTLVSGLPDGGMVAAGKSVVIARQSTNVSFQYSPQPIDGIAVALAAFRDPASGEVRAFVSVAPPVLDPSGSPTNDVGGFPAGDGELLRDTGAGWADLTEAQYPGTGITSEGVPQPNPVLAVAAAQDGSAAWAVGGYAGTITASGAGFDVPLQARPAGVETASIWRYDTGGSAVAPTLAAAQVAIPALPGTVSFAFFSGIECNAQCAAVQNAQPDVNLAGAAAEIGLFAAQPGGPAFAMLGGNAVGPSSMVAYQAGNGAADLADLHNYLSGLSGLPLFAAYGPLDSVPTSANPAQPWGDAFAQAPAPFGLGAVPSGIIPVSSGGTNGSVHHDYSFEVAQNGGALFVIVLDNSAGSLERSVAGQTAWLGAQLVAAQAAGLPVVVFCAEPLNSAVPGAASDADAVAATLAAAGVLAVFTTSPTQSDVQEQVPFSLNPLGPQIPEYEGASLGYQQPQNNGVLWYEVSIDTVALKVTVQGIPVVQSLALEPLGGLTVARSSTLSFRAVGRRPSGTVPSYYNYVSIPTPSCSGCVAPSYEFQSSNPAIGTFVLPSGPGSLFPLLNASGKPIPSSSSGLFCAFNAGTTTVSVTSGLLTSSETVTVLPGAIGQPCGTVTYAPAENVVTIPGKASVSTAGAPAGASVPPPPAPASGAIIAPLPAIAVPPPPAPAAPTATPVAPAAHVAAKAPAPAPPAVTPPFQPQAAAAGGVAPVLVPPITPPVSTVPPGGATASSTATARREEKARRHARQSAFTVRPAGAPGLGWFYGVVGAVSVLAVLLAAEALSTGPGRRREGLEAWELLGTRYHRRQR